MSKMSLSLHFQFRKLKFLSIYSIIATFVFSLNCSINSNGVGYLSFKPISEISMWLIVLLLVSVVHTLFFSGFDLELPILLLSFILSALSLLGQCLEGTSYLFLLYDSFGHIVRTICTIVFLTFFYYLLIQIVFLLVSSFDLSRVFQRFNGFISKQNTLVLAVAIIVFWLPYLIGFFPGSLPTDTSRQIGQWFGARGVALDNHFPYFTTLIYSQIYSFGRLFCVNGVFSMFLLTMFQMVCGSVVFAYSLKKIDIIFHQNLLIPGLLFFGFFPIIPVYVVSISKDYLHAVFIVLYLVELLSFFKASQSNNNHKTICEFIILIIVSILVMLTRNNGFVIVFAGAFLLLFLTNSFVLKWINIGLLVAFYFIWNQLFLPAAGVLPTEAGEALSMPVQMVGSVYKSTEYIPSDLNFEIRSFFDSTDFDIRAEYNPLISDPLKGHLKFDKNHTVFDFIVASLKLALLHPVASLSGALTTTFAYWYPFTQGTYWMEDAPYYSWDSWSLIDAGWFDGYSWSSEWNSKHQIDSHSLNEIHLNSVLSVFYKPGFYFWMYLFITFYSYKLRSSFNYVILVLLPLLCLSLSLIAGPCASLRYTLPFIFTLPLITSMFFSLRSHDIETSK